MWMNARQIIEEILNGLFTYEQLRHRRCVDRIIEQNSARGRFLYADRTFVPSNNPPARVTLDSHLFPQIDKLILDIENVEHDRKLFSQVLFNVLGPCSSRQDVGDTLPVQVVQCVPFLKPVLATRVKPEGHSVADNPRAAKQFEDIRDKLELYAQLQLNPALSSVIGYYNFEA